MEGGRVLDFGRFIQEHNRYLDGPDQPPERFFYFHPRHPEEVGHPTRFGVPYIDPDAGNVATNSWAKPLEYRRTSTTEGQAFANCICDGELWLCTSFTFGGFLASIPIAGFWQTHGHRNFPNGGWGTTGIDFFGIPAYDFPTFEVFLHVSTWDSTTGFCLASMVAFDDLGNLCWFQEDFEVFFLQGGPNLWQCTSIADITWNGEGFLYPTFFVSNGAFTFSLICGHA